MGREQRMKKEGWRKREREEKKERRRDRQIATDIGLRETPGIQCGLPQSGVWAMQSLPCQEGNAAEMTEYINHSPVNSSVGHSPATHTQKAGFLDNVIGSRELVILRK